MTSASWQPVTAVNKLCIRIYKNSLCNELRSVSTHRPAGERLRGKGTPRQDMKHSPHVLPQVLYQEHLKTEEQQKQAGLAQTGPSVNRSTTLHLRANRQSPSTRGSRAGGWEEIKGKGLLVTWCFLHKCPGLQVMETPTETGKPWATSLLV